MAESPIGEAALEKKGKAALPLLVAGDIPLSTELIPALAYLLSTPAWSTDELRRDVYTSIIEQDLKARDSTLEALIQLYPHDVRYQHRILGIYYDREQIIPTESAVHWLVDHLRADDIKWNASRASEVLKRERPTSTDAPLILALESEDRQLRLEAAEVLLATRDPRSLPPSFWPALVENLHDEERIEAEMEEPDEHRRERYFDIYRLFNARSTMEFFLANREFVTGSEYAGEYLRQGLASSDDQFRWLSAYLLAVSGDVGSADKIAPVLISGLWSGWNAPRMAMYGLSRLGPSAKSYLVAHEGKGNLQARTIIAVLLARIKNPEISIWHIPSVYVIDEQYIQLRSKSEAGEELTEEEWDQRNEYISILDLVAQIDEEPYSYHFDPVLGEASE